MRKGHLLGKWMPLEIEPWLSDPDIQSWYDDQEKWYLRLLLQAWKNSANPCHLPNEPERLMTLAGVSAASPIRVRAWRDRSAAVLRKFVTSEDGKWLYNSKQLEVYLQQGGVSEARSEAGRLGGLAKASKARDLLQQSSGNASLSSSHKKKESFDSEDFVSRIMAIGFRDSTHRSKSLVEWALSEEVEAGAIESEVLAALTSIFTWTEKGVYAPKCFEVIPRWREPRELWERRNGTSQPSATEAKHERSKAAVTSAANRYRESAGAADAGDAGVLPK